MRALRRQLGSDPGRRPWRVSDVGAGRLGQIVDVVERRLPPAAARHGDKLALVNAKFDTGLPPTADTYEVVVVDR